jgi:hypothetical protein
MMCNLLLDAQVAQRRAQAKGRMEEEEWDFAALANAMVVKDAETYYRSMYFSGVT